MRWKKSFVHQSVIFEFVTICVLLLVLGDSTVKSFICDAACRTTVMQDKLQTSNFKLLTMKYCYVTSDFLSWLSHFSTGDVTSSWIHNINLTSITDYSTELSYVASSSAALSSRLHVTIMWKHFRLLDRLACDVCRKCLKSINKGNRTAMSVDHMIHNSLLIDSDQQVTDIWDDQGLL